MADRDIRVNLQLKAAGDAPAALKDAAGRADALGKSYKALGLEADRAARSTRGLADEAAKVKQPGGAGLGMRPGMAGAAPPQLPMALQKPAQPQGIAGQLGIGQETLQAGAAAGATAFAAISVTAKALSATAKAIEALGDESKSANQALRTFAEGLPVAGEVFKSLGELADAVSGKSAILRKLSREDQLKTAEAQGLVGKYQTETPLKSQQLANEALSGALGNSPKFNFGAGAPSRDTLQGDLAYAQYERRSSLEIDRRNAEAQAQAAQVSAAAAEKERKRLQTALDPLSASNATATAALDALPKGLQPTQSLGQASAGDWLKGTLKALTVGGMDPRAWKATGQALLGPTVGASFETTDKLKGGGELKASLQEELKLRQMLTTAAQQEMATAKAAAEAESKARQANLALLKDDLATLKEKEAQIKGSAQGFGGLEAADKQAALEASNRFKALGGGGGAFEQLTPEERAAIAAAGGGQVLAFAGQQSAMNDPRFKALQQNLGLDFDLAANQEKQLKLQSQISMNVQVDTDGLAKTLTDTLKPVVETLIKNLGDLVNVQLAQIKVGQHIANNS